MAVPETNLDRRAAVKTAVRDAIAAPLDQRAIEYLPSSVGLDSHRYTIDQVNTLRNYPADERITAAVAAEFPHVEIELLGSSPHWEDRIRAEAVSAALRKEITLPDGFPCIYEPVDSPNMARVLHPRPNPWVVSPDMGMLEELLPLYRELWAAYENQWPHTPNRVFEVGRLDDLPARAVYRPGTTPAEVIGATMVTHDGIYARAPEHLRRMHPLHERWQQNNAELRKKLHPYSK